MSTWFLCFFDRYQLPRLGSVRAIRILWSLRWREQLQRHLRFDSTMTISLICCRITQWDVLRISVDPLHTSLCSICRAGHRADGHAKNCDRNTQIQPEFPLNYQMPGNLRLYPFQHRFPWRFFIILYVGQKECFSFASQELSNFQNFLFVKNYFDQRDFFDIPLLLTCDSATRHVYTCSKLLMLQEVSIRNHVFILV